MPAEHPLRTAAASFGAYFRRDRADALYIARGNLPPHPYFSCETRGDFCALYPTKEACGALAEFLCADIPFGFAHFSGKDLAQEDCVLLAQGVKLLETTATPAQTAQFEKNVRRRAAVLLRKPIENEGGSLPLCMYIAQMLYSKQKGA